MAQYLVFCTFDLKNATAKNYSDAYAALAKLGLRKVVLADDRTDAVVPTTSAMGYFDANSSIGIRDLAYSSVKSAFSDLRLKSEIFIIAGTDWSWVAGRT